MSCNLGVFITFEGTEGTGKSTLIKNLAKKLREKSVPVLLTREPGGTPLAEKIRKILLNDVMPPWCELFLYEAARADHVTHKIVPALKAGKIILCDRFTDSSLAYQGYARGLPWNEVKKLNDLATQKLRPHLHIFLDLPVSIGLKRAKIQTRFEKEGLQFQRKVRNGFQKAYLENKKKWIKFNVQNYSRAELCAVVLKQILKAKEISKKIK